MGEKHCLTFAISEVVLKVPLYFFLLSRFLQQYHIWVFRLKKKSFFNIYNVFAVVEYVTLLSAKQTYIS